MAEHEAASLAAALSVVLTTGFVPQQTAGQLCAWLPSATELRLSVAATGNELAITSSLLQPQRFTVSVQPIPSADAGACIASGQPRVSLWPAPQLCVPIDPTPSVHLPGVPRACGCLQVAFATSHASDVFRRAASLARELAATLPQHAAPLVAEVRELLAAQPWPQLAQQYVIELQPHGDHGSDVSASSAQRLCSSTRVDTLAPASGSDTERASPASIPSDPGISAASCPSSMSSLGCCPSQEQAAEGQACQDSARTSCRDAGGGAAGINWCRRPSASAACGSGEIQPCSQQPGHDAAASCQSPSACDAPEIDAAPATRWPQPSAQRQALLQAAFEADGCLKAGPVQWPGGGKWHCCWDGPPRQSRLTLAFADWRMEQLFQPWRAAVCWQDDAAAVQVVAPLAILIGCCQPLQLFAARPGFAQWAGHAVLLLLYLAVHLVMARAPAAWLPRWRHHALVVLWAVAAAHATRFMVQAVVGGGLLQGVSSPMAFFRSSGLETLATCALVLRVQWAQALPLLTVQALLAMQHLPAACGSTDEGATAAAASWLAGFACRRGAATLALHWVAMGLLPVVMTRAMDAALRRRFARQLCGEAAVAGGRAAAGPSFSGTAAAGAGDSSLGMLQEGAASRRCGGEALPRGSVTCCNGVWETRDQHDGGGPSS